MLKRDGSFMIERTTSSHAPLGMMNTKGEHEAYQDPPPWMLAFSDERKRFPDRSHQRRKEKEAAQKETSADRLRNIEE